MSVMQLFRQAAARRHYDEAASHADQIISVMGEDTPAEVINFLDSASDKSKHAALVRALTYLYRKEPEPGFRMKLLQDAVKSRDDVIKSSAYLAIGVETLMYGDDPKKAISPLKKSYEYGNMDSSLVLAEAYEDGLFGQRGHLKKAFNILADAADEGFAPAKLALSKFVVNHGIHHPDYHPRDLLQEAAEEGLDEAATLLVIMDQIDEAASILPYEVVPVSMERPVQIKNAFLNETDMPPEFAGVLIAKLHGFESWEALEAAVNSPDKVPGPFDEDTSPEKMVARKQFQLHTLAHYINAIPPVHEAFWSLLRPTSRDYRPSLRNLDSTIDEFIALQSSGASFPL